MYGGKEVTIKSDFEKAFDYWFYESAIKQANTTNYDIAHWAFIQGMKKCVDLCDRSDPNAMSPDIERVKQNILSAIKEFES